MQINTQMWWAGQKGWEPAPDQIRGTPRCLQGTNNNVPTTQFNVQVPDIKAKLVLSKLDYTRHMSQRCSNLTRSQTGRTKGMTCAGVLKQFKRKLRLAKIGEWAVRSWAMGRLIVTPMLVGPMFCQTLQPILRRQMGHYATG